MSDESGKRKLSILSVKKLGSLSVKNRIHHWLDSLQTPFIEELTEVGGDEANEGKCPKDVRNHVREELLPVSSCESSAQRSNEVFKGAFTPSDTDLGNLFSDDTRVPEENEVLRCEATEERDIRLLPVVEVPPCVEETSDERMCEIETNRLPEEVSSSVDDFDPMEMFPCREHFSSVEQYPEEDKNIFWNDSFLVAENASGPTVEKLFLLKQNHPNFVIKLGAFLRHTFGQGLRWFAKSRRKKDYPTFCDLCAKLDLQFQFSKSIGKRCGKFYVVYTLPLGGDNES
ncbi:unnamed protein product [Notodromas monacha]|uniref:Uncharacterized protein n=1 Tax=Notodromas monacha TaxID=399045 RepID=A0A7R9BLA1_9CRUS|nr:unnamed protein product [Notodromas monacha]CAG0916212.1 unnamed protein product [Notodromas monacha]